MSQPYNDRQMAIIRQIPPGRAMGYSTSAETAKIMGQLIISRYVCGDQQEAARDAFGLGGKPGLAAEVQEEWDNYMNRLRQQQDDTKL